MPPAKILPLRLQLNVTLIICLQDFYRSHPTRLMPFDRLYSIASVSLLSLASRKSMTLRLVESNALPLVRLQPMLSVRCD